MDKIKEDLRLLIGNLIILFQRYEYTFKSLLTLSFIQRAAESIENNLNNRFESISKKSLGQLVRQYLDEIVDQDEFPEIDDTKVQAPNIRTRQKSRK